eukprot:scaffold115593_cov54-Phaeocystis_antarctica.AAC.1
MGLETTTTALRLGCGGRRRRNHVNERVAGEPRGGSHAAAGQAVRCTCVARLPGICEQLAERGAASRGGSHAAAGRRSAAQRCSGSDRALRRAASSSAAAPIGAAPVGAARRGSPARVHRAGARGRVHQAHVDEGVGGEAPEQQAHLLAVAQPLYRGVFSECEEHEQPPGLLQRQQVAPPRRIVTEHRRAAARLRKAAARLLRGRVRVRVRARVRVSWQSSGTPAPRRASPPQTGAPPRRRRRRLHLRPASRPPRGGAWGGAWGGRPVAGSPATRAAAQGGRRPLSAAARRPG